MASDLGSFGAITLARVSPCAATANGADTIGKGDRLGRIGEGKLADLLVIDGDPTTDITCLRDPANMPIIMKDGEFARDALAV